MTKGLCKAAPARRTVIAITDGSDGSEQFRSMYLETVPDNRASDSERRNSHSTASTTSGAQGWTEDGQSWSPSPYGDYATVDEAKETALSRPKKLIPDHVNRAFHNLTLSDIDGTHPKLKQPFQKARGTDPLEPAYVMPAYEEPESGAGRFVKDTLDVSDVEGAKVRQTVIKRITDPLKVDDIPGSTAAWRPTRWNHFGKPGHIRDFSLQIDDINARVRRKVRESTAAIYAPLEGSQPRPLIRHRHNLQEQDFNIRTDDIPGARSPVKKRPESAAPRTSNHLSGIRGAGADSRSFEGRLTDRKTAVNARAERAHLRNAAQTDALATELRGRVSRELCAKTAKEVMLAFKRNDRSGSGKLTADELSKSFGQLNVPLAPAEAEKLASAFDTQLSGFVDYVDLAKSFAPHIFKGTETDAGAPAAGKRTRPQSANPLVQSTNRIENRALIASDSCTSASVPLSGREEPTPAALLGETSLRQGAENVSETRRLDAQEEATSSRAADRTVSFARDVAEAAQQSSSAVSPLKSNGDSAPYQRQSSGSEGPESATGRPRPTSSVATSSGRGTAPDGKPAPISLFQDYVEVGGGENPGNHLVWDLQPETGRIPGTERLFRSQANGTAARPHSASTSGRKTRGSGVPAATDTRAFTVHKLKAQAAAIAARSGGYPTAEMDFGAQWTDENASWAARDVRPQTARPPSVRPASGSELVAELGRSASVNSTDSERPGAGYVSSAWVQDAVRRTIAAPQDANERQPMLRKRPQSARPSSARFKSNRSLTQGEGSGVGSLKASLEAQREAQWLKEEVAIVRALA